MRLPYLRAAAPEVCATARAQRWDPAEVLRVLMAEEVAGRDRATRTARRRAAGLPPAKPSTPGARPTRPSPCPPRPPCAPWNGSAEPRTWPSADRPGTGKSHFCEALAHAVIDAGMRVSWFTLETLTAALSRARLDATIDQSRQPDLPGRAHRHR